MVNAQLLDFVRLQLKMGASPEEIRNALASGTWTSADIDEAFAAAADPSTIAVPMKPAAPSAYQAPAQASQTAPSASASFVNTSGQGKASVVPPEVKRWNWGAFGFNWIWGIGNGTYIALLCLIPLVNLVMIFVLGAKGSEWAWRNERWESVEHFKRVQRRWSVVWLIFLMAGILIWVGTIALGIGLSGKVGSEREQARDAKRLSDMDMLSIGLELYHDQNQAYPSSLQQLVPTFESSVPLDPSTQAPYQYQASGGSYQLCAHLEETTPPSYATSGTFSNGEYCLAPASQ